MSKKTKTKTAVTPPSPPATTPKRAGDIRPAPYNPRTITPEQLETLGNTMAEFGDLSGVVFNTRTGHCVGGHQRLKQLDPEWPIEKRSVRDSTGTVALGAINTPWGAFQYREVDWPIEKEQAANLAANQAGGEFDFDAVGRILQDIDGKIPLSLTAFDSKELDDILSDLRKKAPDAADESSDDDEENKKPEIEIAPEARERHDYVLILCDNDLDWTSLSQFLGLKNARTAQVAARTMHSVGLNRVIKASDFLKKVLNHD